MTSVVAAASPRAAAAPAKATKHRKERLKLPRAPKLAPIDGAEEPAPAVPSLAAAAPAVACPFSPGARANVAGPRPAGLFLASSGPRRDRIHRRHEGLSPTQKKL